MASGSRKPSNMYSDSTVQMGLGSDLKKSSRRSKTVKETAFPTQVKETVKQHDKLEGKYCSSKPQRGQPRERRQSSISTGSHQKESVKAKTTREDELVKYMSNLPGYLQRLEKGGNFQENAFHVGVLDWSRLEKWKGNHRFDPADVRSSLSVIDSGNLSTKMSKKLSSPVSTEGHSCPSVSSSTNSTCSDGISSGAKSVGGNSMQFQHSESNSRSNLGGDKRVPWTYKASSKNGYEGVLEKGKEKGLEQRTSSRVRPRQTIPARPRDNLNVCDNDASKRGETKVKDLYKKVVSSSSPLPSKLRISDVPPNLKESRKIGCGETKKQMGDLQKSCTAHSSEVQPVDKRNIVLLWPRKLSEYGSSEDQPRVSLDGTRKKAVHLSYSGRFSHVEVQSSAHSSEIPYSCPLPLAVPNVKLDKVENTALEQSSDAHHNLMILLASEAEKSSDMATNLNATGTKTPDQETADSAARKCRHPSPNRHLGFSLSLMARSLSFKESSSVPQLNSTYVSVKSGPITSKGFACNDDSNKEKGSVPNRARSSPLRRILDPLLKSKGATASAFHSTKTNFPLKGSFDSFGITPFNAIESFDGEKRDTSSVDAHLQIVMKNGLPLLRFVVHNNSSILVAAKMNVTPSVRNDSGCYYTFYSIDEIKKKAGNWINQSSKEKSCDFVYNVIGQMRINSSCSSDSNEQYFVKEFMINESVLFGVEVRQVDHASTKLRPSRELAAVVVRIPTVAQGHDQVEALMENGFTSSTSTNDSTTVILPGGIHGLPNKGVLSPLIHRWKSGGSCDCGGWDVGCKLHVLTNDGQQWQNTRTSDSHLTAEHLELFLQERAQRDNPMFSMTLLERGLYSVKFSRSFSFLQAFFICVTRISCHSSPDLAEAANLFEEKIHQESSTRNEKNYKNYTSFPGEAPAKYAPSPPFSPFGRV